MLHRGQIYADDGVIAIFSEDWQEGNLDLWTNYNTSPIHSFEDVGGGDLELRCPYSATSSERLFGIESSVNTFNDGSAFYFDLTLLMQDTNNIGIIDLWFLSSGTPSFGGNDGVGEPRLYVQFQSAFADSRVDLRQRTGTDTSLVSGPLTVTSFRNIKTDFRLIVGEESGGKRIISLIQDPEGAQIIHFSENITLPPGLGVKWGIYSQLGSTESSGYHQFGDVVLYSGSP